MSRMFGTINATFDSIVSPTGTINWRRERILSFSARIALSWS
jgi:hypothetical protein